MLKFNGNNSYGVIPAELLGGKTDLTIEITVDTNETRAIGSVWNSYQFIGIEVPGHNKHEFGFGSNGGYLGLFDGSNERYLQSSIKINDGRQKKIVLTNSNGTMSLYLVTLNNDRSKTVTLAEQTGFGSTLWSNYYLGFNGAGFYCQYNLYDLAIYDRALEVEQFFSKTITPASKYNLYTRKYYSDGKMIDIMGNYNISTYNTEFKADLNGNAFFSNIKNKVR